MRDDTVEIFGPFETANPNSPMRKLVFENRTCACRRAHSAVVAVDIDEMASSPAMAEWLIDGAISGLRDSIWVCQGDQVKTVEQWDAWHTERDISADSGLCNLLTGYLEPVAGKAIVDLGCGQGADTIRLARCGAIVLGVDVSAVAIAKAQAGAEARGAYPRAVFTRHDLSSGRLPVNLVGPLDAVLANLSLHYFELDTLRSIFRAVFAVLRPGGLFAFAVKQDRIRRFLSDEGEELLMADRPWESVYTDEVCERYQSPEESVVIRVLLRKRDELWDYPLSDAQVLKQFYLTAKLGEES